MNAILHQNFGMPGHDGFSVMVINGDRGWRGRHGVRDEMTLCRLLVTPRETNKPYLGVIDAEIRLINIKHYSDLILFLFLF